MPGSSRKLSTESRGDLAAGGRGAPLAGAPRLKRCRAGADPILELLATPARPAFTASRVI